MAANTYISDIGGNVVIPFQFSLAELSGSESANFSERVRTGGFEPELIWISGQVRRLTVPFFIDRTEESRNYQVQSNLPTRLDNQIRFPSRYPRISQEDALSYEAGLKNSEPAPGATSKSANEVERSQYVATADFKQYDNDGNQGVYRDLELFLYFIRPFGVKLSTGKFDDSGAFSIKDSPESRFTPPPMCRFFHGNYWIQGYVGRLNYNMTAMNSLLVPRRLDGTIEFIIEKDGILSEVK